MTGLTAATLAAGVAALSADETGSPTHTYETKRFRASVLTLMCCDLSSDPPPSPSSLARHNLVCERRQTGMRGGEVMACGSGKAKHEEGAMQFLDCHLAAFCQMISVA